MCSKDPSIRVVVDLGHHAVLGLLPPLATLLGPSKRVAIVRVIRARYDTVRSFLAEQFGE